jgi:hypothetical protein
MLLVAYLLVYSLLTLFLFYKVEGMYIIKIASVAMAFTVATVTYFSLDSFKGWSTSDEVTQTVQLLAIHTQEPNGATAGGIYLWVVGETSDPSIKLGLLTYQSVFGETRAHVLPYSEENATFSYKAQKALEEGMIVILNPKLSEGTGDGEGGEGGADADKGGTFYQDEIPSDWRIINPVEQLVK